MKTSETLAELIGCLPPTIGNHPVKCLLREVVAEVVNLELERDDAIEELKQMQELADESL